MLLKSGLLDEGFAWELDYSCDMSIRVSIKPSGGASEELMCSAALLKTIYSFQTTETKHVYFGLYFSGSRK